MESEDDKWMQHSLGDLEAVSRILNIIIEFIECL